MEIAIPVTHAASQAGLWRRACALLLDLAAVHAALALAGVLLFQATDGFVRVGKLPFVESAVCRSLTNTFRSDARSDTVSTTTCESDVFGFVHDRRTELSDERRTGAVTVTRSHSYPVDADGRATRAFYLDHLVGFLLAAYLLVAEWRFGTTLGKRALDMCVQMRDGGPPRLVNAGKRLLRLMPLLPLAPIGSMAMTIDPAGELALSSGYEIVVMVLYLVSAALWLAVGANFVMAEANGALPWHDRWAGTDVVMSAPAGADFMAPTRKL
jgi:hypothetical protein